MGNPFGRFRFQTKASVLKRIYSYIFLLRLKAQTATYDEMRAFYATALGSDNGVMIPPSTKGIYSEIIDKLDLLLKVKVNTAVDESLKLLETLSEDQRIQQVEMPSGLEFVSPILTGLANIRTRLLAITNQHLNDPYLRVQLTLECVMAYENDLFKNREGSSKTKRYHMFNKLANALFAKIHSVGSDANPTIATISGLFGNFVALAHLRVNTQDFLGKFHPLSK